jgi:hypothetical protein
MSYYPILIQLLKDGQTLVINRPQDIPSGVGFIVLAVNYPILEDYCI